MPSNSPRAVLDDILTNIDRAKHLISGETLEILSASWIKLYAPARCLEIISEASRRLSNDTRDRHPTIPWRDVADAGNVFRYEYPDVDALILWDTVAYRLGELRQAAAAEIGVLEGGNPS
jgi:uncharacterized protein with HEPN domain